MTDCAAWIGGLALTTYSNELSAQQSVEDKDVTTFGSTYKSRIGGLKTVEASLKGFWESAVDAEGVTLLGTSDQVCTFCPTGSTETSAALFFQAGNFSYQTGGGIGDVAPFELSMMGSNGVGAVQGQLAKAKGNVSATGALGSGLNLGAVSATQYLYAAFHVFTAGTTITVKIESDDNANFTSATDRITFSAITTTGGTWATRLAGAVTDTYYRFNVTAITGTFNVAASIGIA